MSLRKYIYIFRGKSMTSKDKVEINNDQFHFIAVGVNQPSEAIAIAKKAVNDGVEAIELCGALGKNTENQILSAIKHVVPVGYTSYPQAKETPK